MYVRDSDSDSAISSMGSHQSSTCSCDSCTCDISFSSCDSEAESLPSAVNPFGSFRHSGALPYSLFEDSSSFSCSRIDETIISAEEGDTLQNSTHIYINTLDQTDCGLVKSTKYWSVTQEESILLKSRPECEGKECSIAVTENWSDMSCNVNEVESKVGPWLQTCLTEPIPQVSSDDDSTGKDTSVDSDVTSFFEHPLHSKPVTARVPTKKQRFCIAKKLREFGRLLYKQRKKKTTLQTLAVI